MDTPFRRSTLSRRNFTQLLGAGAAYAALRPLGAGVEAAFAATASPPSPPQPSGVVRLSANENPYGPSPQALAAIQEALPHSNRYPDEPAKRLAEEVAALHGVDHAQIILGDGSSELLKLAAAACCGPGRAAVVADPTFEALGRYAEVAGGEVTRVPLMADFRHDLPRMLAAAQQAGIVYVCNPNNPTASVTPKTELRSFLRALPKSVVALVDEAYHHYADGPTYESVAPLVGELPNLLVTRTFSKIYGMAGLRCGYGVAQVELAERLRRQAAWDSLNVMAIAAARASLQDGGHVERARALNGETRAVTCAKLEKLGHRVIPSSANFFMVELGRDVRPTIEALKAHGVEVGRLFPALPTHLRVTVGTAAEMKSFLAAFRAVTLSARAA